MRVGWEPKLLSEVIQLEYGKPLDPADRNPSGSYPAYGANGEKSRTDKFYCERPSIIVGRKGSAGEITLTEDKFWPLDVTYFIEFDRKQYDLQFLYYLLTTLDLPSLAKGVKPGINRNEVYALPVHVPLIPEQQRIVAILDEAFDGIATARANTEKNLQNARALFESHLQSVFTQRGEGWVELPLCNVASILSGYAFKSGDFSSDGPVKSIKITNVGVREFVETPDNGLPSAFSEKFASVAVPAGSLVIALTRTIISDGIKVAVVPASYGGALVNQRVAGLLANPKLVSASYLFAYLSTSMVLNYVKDRVNTLMQPNLSINDLRAMPIPLPPEGQQESIIDRLLGIEEETQRLESLYQRKLAALAELKKSLLHKAFSGEL